MAEELGVESTEETSTIDISEDIQRAEDTEEQMESKQDADKELDAVETESQDSLAIETESQMSEDETEIDSQIPERVTEATASETDSQIQDSSTGQTTSSEVENKEPEKSEVVSITSFEVLESHTKENTVITGLTDDVTFQVFTTLGGDAETVWLGYRFELPEKSSSGGKYNFANGTYSWLQPLDGQGQIAVKKENGKLILEGKVLAQHSSGNISPGLYSPTITVSVSNLVNNETATLQAQCWVINSEDTKHSASATLTAQGTSNYSAIAGTIEHEISGYFNTETGEFSLYKPENAEGYTYGRIYSSRALAWQDSMTERLDPTQPLSFDVSYELVRKEGKEEEQTVTDPEKQPVLMAIKRSDKNVIESQLEGTPIQEDFTLGGLITDESYKNGPSNTAFYHGGEYTFSRNKDQSIHVSAVLSPDNKDSGYNHAASYALVFVPVDEESEEDADVTYRLKATVKNVSGISYSGTPIQDVTENGEDIGYITIPPKGKDENIPIQGLFSRKNYFTNSVQTIQKGQSIGFEARISNNSPSNIADYNIDAINMLLKFEEGLTYDGTITYGSDNSYTGSCKFLYGIKADGTGWKDEIELNHTQDYQLRYYDTYESASQYGTVVAILAEFRGGRWVKDEYLKINGRFKATGDNGTSQILVQDVKVWRNQQEIESWSGTNGNDVSQEIDPTDFMKPYDNPNNTIGPEDQHVYRRDTWPDDAVIPQPVEDHTWGDTLYIIGGIIQRIDWEDEEYPSVNLNGTNRGEAHGAWNEDWSNSTFDVSLGQRVVDRVYCFEVRDVGVQELSLKVTLDQPYNAKSKYLSRTGKVYLSTEKNPVTYIPNTEEGKMGSFKGGKVIDPNNFTVPGDGKYKIYFSSFIGDIKELEKDVPPGVLWNYTSIEAIGNTLRYAKVGETNTAHSTYIIKTSTTSVAKTSTSETTTDKAEYTLMLDVDSISIPNTFVLDILPYDNDDAGSDFHGSYTLSGNKIQVSYQKVNGAAQTRMRLFYTTEDKIQTVENGRRLEADIFKGLEAENLENSFTAGGVQWEEANSNSEGTVFEIPEGITPTAVVFAGEAKADERMTATISLDLKGQKIGDTYHNKSSTKLGVLEVPLSSSVAQVTVIGRDISGTAWQDQNQNGIFDEEDSTLSNVKVRLYQADGTEIIQTVVGESYGEIETDPNGRYCFENVPESTQGYYVKFESPEDKSLDDYQTIEPYKSGANSPYEKNDDSDLIFQQDPQQEVKTEIFNLLSNQELANSNFVQRATGINAGFEKVLAAQVKKEWKGTAEDEVTVQLQRRKASASQWESVETKQLNKENSWKTTFGKRPVLYKDTVVGRYEYRVAEIDQSQETQEAVEDGGSIVLNGKTYQVKYDKTGDDAWTITNVRMMDAPLPHVGGSGAKGIAFAGALCIAGGSFLIFRKRRKRPY